MRLPTLSSLFCLAGLVSVPVTALNEDIKSIPVGPHCLYWTARDTEVLIVLFYSFEPTVSLRYDTP